MLPCHVQVTSLGGAFEPGLAAFILSDVVLQPTSHHPSAAPLLHLRGQLLARLARTGMCSHQLVLEDGAEVLWGD